MSRRENEYLKIPEPVRVAMFLYVREHADPGGFLKAVLSNDLRGAVACGYGDEGWNSVAQIVRWFHNHATGNCWGTPEKVDRWLSTNLDTVGWCDHTALELPEEVTHVR